MSYLGRSAKLSLKAQEKVSFLATAGQTVKTGLSYTPSFVEVYVNGVLLTDTTDYTATNGNSVTFTVALLLNDEVTVISLKTFTVADHYNKTEADTLLAAKAPIASPSFTGNVGIGTSSPARELDIVGNANVSGGYYANNASGTFLWNTANAPIAFGTNNAQRMTINAAGNVGIGETSPARFLHVKDPTGGNIVAFFESTDANGSLSIGDNSGSVNVESDAGAMVLNVNGNTSNGGGLTEAMRITSDGRGLSEFTAKAWLQFKQTGTQAIRDSHNVSSITDLGVGFTRINFSNNLANINYSAVDSYTVQSNISNISSNVTDYLVSSYTIAHRENGSLIDTSRISSIVFGS